MRRMRFLLTIGVASILLVAIYTGVQVRPRLAAMFHRHPVLAGVTARFDERYDTKEPDALLDVFYPSQLESAALLPTIVWVHGGAFSGGSKDDIASYLEILAAKNFTVVGVNYSLAPARHYPTPILQVNTALAFLSRNEARLHVDARRVFLAGDSAGAQIVGQLATVISSSLNAKRIGVVPSIDRGQLHGVILHCGVYDYLRNNDEGINTAAQRYLGSKLANDPRLEELSLVRNITADFPPIFVSVGNADRFAPQSRSLAATATKLGIQVDSLFFPDDYKPSLPHEYQFNLNLEASQLALERTAQFIAARL